MLNKKIIIIAGYLASGKSTFATRLSREINVPYLIKDAFKTAICASIPVTGREESRRYSAATFDAIAYVAERLMETDYPLIVEGNFMMGGHKKVDEGETLRLLIKKYGYASLTYIFYGNIRVMCDRFNAREKLPERGQANRLFSALSYEDGEKWLPPLAEFTVGGKTVKVDTTDFKTVDYRRLIDTAKIFFKNE